MMNVTNQERCKLNMPQVIIEDNILDYNWFGKTVDELNSRTLESMYHVQDEIYNLFGLCDMSEIGANTINPAQQNIFIPLKSWNINLGGCFAEVSIYQRILEGCFAEIKY